MGISVFEVMTVFFHASPTEGIRRLDPRVSNHQKPLVYLSSKRENVLVYLSNAVEKYCRETGFVHSGSYYKWASYGFNREGLLVLEEYWPNAILETYAGVSGYIYTAQAPAAQKQEDIPFAYISAEPVEITGCEYVPDAYDVLLEAQHKGLLILKRYNENSEKTLQWIERTIQSEYTKAEERPEYRAFLQAKFKHILIGEH